MELSTATHVHPSEPKVSEDEELRAARRRLLNPTSAEFLQDPYATYALLRERQPLCYRPRSNAWVATRYEDAQAVLRDPCFGRDPEPTFEAIHGPGINDEPVVRNFNRMMIVRNDPDHSRLRKLVNASFNARRVLSLKAAIARIANELVDRLPASGEVDLMVDFARPLPVTVICELLGIPEADRQRFIDRRVVSERIFVPVPLTPEELAEENRRFLELRDYFLSLCAERRRAPREDLISDLVAAKERGELDEEELIAMIAVIFNAGHDTTVNLIGNGLLALHRHPEQLALLRARPDLMPSAVDELLRYDSSVQTSDRRALESVELGGQRIEKGQLVVCVLGAANRDPEVYPDPDRLDITRSGTKPVAFGGGIHFCLGAQLARIEGQIALGALLSRLPDISLPELERPEWSPSVFLRGLETLPARYQRRLDSGFDVAATARPTGAATKATARCPFH
ncbi:MAG: cytochrome P450 [Myxococcales bacterium]|nr:cytochrome P450 [Myxococcales bacterium]